MDRQQIALSLVLREAGVPFAVDSFDHRLVLQKAVYLLQEAGVPLGYHFRWYLYGPYSPELTQDAFAIVVDGKNANDDSKATSLASSAAETCRRISSVFHGSDLHQLARKLELLASTLFLIRTKQANPESPQRIADLLRAFGKPFQDEQVKDGLALLRTHGFAF